MDQIAGLSPTTRTQPELRKDPIMGRWVIIATERAHRPLQITEGPTSVRSGPCPFCGGNEAETPLEVATWRDGTTSNGQGWQVRVVPNKFPALRGEGDTDLQSEGIFDCMNGIGVHEVFIESPDHVTSLTELPERNIRATLRLYRDRLKTLKEDPRLVYGMVFKNVGSQAGASLEHTHSQLIVLPIVPINVREEMQGSLAYYQEQGECIFCSMTRQEQEASERLVTTSAHFTAFCPFASRFPFETWIVPNTHASHYEELPEPEIRDLATVLKTVLRSIEQSLAYPAYNYILHTAPFDTPFLPHYHWHLEIIPRLTRMAGFEWGTGFYINPTPPESAATILRETLEKATSNGTSR